LRVWKRKKEMEERVCGSITMDGEFKKKEAHTLSLDLYVGCHVQAFSLSNSGE